MPDLPPLALYIHIPWCVRKCPYCDFNSHTASPVLPEEEYVDALLADLDQDLHAVYGRELSSIFFGGGTPSLFSAAALGRLLKGVEARIPFAGDIEITLEANPGPSSRKNSSPTANWASIGCPSVSRVSRKRSSRPSAASIPAAKRAGSGYGAPGRVRQLQPGPDARLAGPVPGRCLGDLRQAIALKPTHLSWYQLTLEPNTVFWNQPPTLPEDDTLWDIQEAGQALLAEHGYAQYEVSAYAQPGRAARHNLNYWSFGDFIGIGAGAHGKLSHPDGRIVRTWKTRLPKDYLNPAKAFQAGEKALANEELPFEFLMNALRLTAGVDRRLVCATYRA